MSKASPLVVSLLVAAVCLTGCGTPAKTLALREEGKKAFYLKGVAHVISNGPTGGVSLALLTPTYSKATDELPSFSISYLNTGEVNKDFDVTNIAITCGGKPVRVYTHAEMAAKIERSAARRRMGAALASGMQHMGAAMQASAPRQSYTSGTAQIYTPGSYPTTARFNAQTTTYDPVAASQAQSAASANINAQMAANMDSIQAQTRLQHAQSGDMLRRETVSPGRMITGRVVLHAEDIVVGTPLHITVTVGDDVHRFVCETGGG